MVFEMVFTNPFSDIIHLLDRMNEAGVKPECESFDTGHVASLGPLIDMGKLRTPVQVSLILGVLGGAPPDARTLAHMATLVPADSTWGVIAISRKQWELVAAASSLGGNVRVGLEDNFYTPDGEMAKSNGDLIEAAARLVTLAGRSIASPEQARALLQLKDPADRGALAAWAPSSD
jgi:uncharacterized protein (DUF849 family)